MKFMFLVVVVWHVGWLDYVFINVLLCYVHSLAYWSFNPFLDLEIEDLVNGTPNQGTSRTPGQLLSLTSHLSFVSWNHFTQNSLHVLKITRIYSGKANVLRTPNSIFLNHILFNRKLTTAILKKYVFKLMYLSSKSIYLSLIYEIHISTFYVNNFKVFKLKIHILIKLICQLYTYQLFICLFLKISFIFNDLWQVIIIQLNACYWK